MKLYTEEEVVDLANRITGESTESILSGLTPIELPSGDEIDRQAFYMSRSGVEYLGVIKTDWAKYEAYYGGASWVIEQIKNQANEKD